MTEMNIWDARPSIMDTLVQREEQVDMPLLPFFPLPEYILFPDGKSI